MDKGSENQLENSGAASVEGRIRLLPNALIDQIAAGEVVERPASVVKELVENSLDARATRIRIDVRDGGRALIAVTDNGVGMSPREAKLSLARHATSKVAELSDLETVMSFGFRGEALPAIASIAKMRLFTRAHGTDEGFEITIEAGDVLQERTAGGPEGTRIEVADLFVKIPARRKFLKSEGTEWGHILDWTRRLALALPGVHFELRRDERPAIVWPAVSDNLDRIAAVLGEGEADALIQIEAEEGAGHLHAFVSSPEHTRANSNGIFLFVNGRPVRDKVMRHALLQAYRDLLPRGRFPSAVLFLTLRGSGVDVNVHPAKWEVRFADPQAIHKLIRRAVRDAMASRSWLESGAAESMHPQVPTSQPTSPQPADAQASSAGRVSEWAPPTWGGEGRRSPASTALATGPLPGLASPVDRALADEPLQFGQLRLIGQLLSSYLLVEGKSGLLVIDQHAAHERVLYERLRAEWLDPGVERQGLLIPLNVELEPLAAAALAEQVEVVERLGFEIEPFGEGAIAVRTVPALLSGRDPESLLRELAGELQSSPGGLEPGTGIETRLLAAADRVFATLACHSARRFGDSLDPREQEQILQDLDTIPWAPTCPHGRPVAISYSSPEIERRFGRR